MSCCLPAPLLWNAARSPIKSKNQPPKWCLLITTSVHSLRLAVNSYQSLENSVLPSPYSSNILRHANQLRRRGLATSSSLITSMGCPPRRISAYIRILGYGAGYEIYSTPLLQVTFYLKYSFLNLARQLHSRYDLLLVQENPKQRKERPNPSSCYEVHSDPTCEERTYLLTSVPRDLFLDREKMF